MDIQELSQVLGISTENYKKEPHNDYLLFQFIGAFLDLVEFKDTEGKGCLTNDARNILLYKGFKEALEEGKDQKELTKCCLWLTIGFISSILFVGFLNIGNEETKQIIPKDVLITMNIAKSEIERKIHSYEKVLKHLVSCLDEEYASIYNNEKRRMFQRDIFDSQTLQLGDKIPEHIKQSAIEIKGKSFDEVNKGIPHETNNKSVK